MLRDIAAVAEELGNTPAICRKSYIHPHLLKAYQDESAWKDWQRTATGRAVAGLAPSEGRLLRFLALASRRKSAGAQGRGD